MLKKFLLFFLLAIGGFCSAVARIHIGDLWYEYNETGVTVFGRESFDDDCIEGRVVIPSIVLYHGSWWPVTEIGYRAFEGCTGMTSITIPESVTEIGRRAFAGTGLTSVTIPESVTKIGEEAFRECSSLKSVTIPESVTEIGKGAFSGCSSLKSVTIPESVTKIGEEVFRGCTDMTSITIPESVTEIDISAFRGCTGLKSVTIPKSVTRIGGGAFRGCTGLKSVNFSESDTFSKSGTTIYGEAFSGCPSLALITIPESVTDIREDAFRGSGLRYVVIQSSATRIGKFAFYCENLRAVFFLGNKDIEVDKNVFFNEIRGSYPYYSYCYYGVYYTANDTKIPINLSGEGAKHYVYSLLSSMFESDGKIYVPTSTGARTCDLVAFAPTSDCSDLRIERNVTYTNSQGRKFTFSVDSVNNFGMWHATETLRSLTIDEGIKHIGDFALVSNNKSEANTIDTLRIPSTVGHLGYNCLGLCEKLVSLEMENGNDPMVVRERESGKGLFYGAPIDSIFLGRTLVYDADKAHGYSPFYQLQTLKTVDTGLDCGAVPDYMFHQCENLSRVRISDGVKEIGKWAFYGDLGLETFEIGKGMESIGDEAFSDCVNITTFISYGETPAECGVEALDDINKLECVLYVPKGTEGKYAKADQWSEFYIEGSLETRYSLRFEVDEACEGMGSVIGAGSYNVGDDAVLTAVPADGYKFVKWSDGNTDNPRKIKVTGEMDVNAVFAPEDDAVENVYASKTSVYVEEGNVVVRGADSGSTIRLYSMEGVLMGEKVCDGDEVLIPAKCAQCIAVVKAGDEVHKVIVR